MASPTASAIVTCPVRASPAGSAAVARAMQTTAPTWHCERPRSQIPSRFRSIDVLVCSAGVSGNSLRTQDVSDAEWQRVMAINTDGVFWCNRAVAPGMVERGYGRIVNVASILGLRSAAQLAPYAAAKAGVLSLTQTMALELARHRIRVNALAPGYIETDLNSAFLRSPAGEALARRVPMRRFGQAEDLDGAVLLLVSDAGRFITGATLPVDGGHLLSFI